MKKCIIALIALFYSFLNVNMLFAAAWTQKADFGGEARAYAVGFFIGTKGYIGTGFSSPEFYKDFWEYDPAANTWTQKADFGGEARASAIGFSIGTKGYIGLGYTGSNYVNDIWEYDPAANTWTQKADFGGTARGYAVGFSIGTNGKGYIGTGDDGFVHFVNDIWEYDSAANTWTQRADFGGTARGYAVGFSIGSKGYIGTGMEDSGLNTKDFWEYDPTVDTTDMIPDPFTFTDQTGVALNTTVTSNTITVSGINAAASISITGGTYAVNGLPYTSASGKVSNGDTVTVRMTSSGSYSTLANATLTIGGVSDIFSVTTQAEPDGKGGGCFIATAAFGSPLAGQVGILRQFRDRYLLINDLGQKFVAWYYRNGHVAANYIKDKPLAKVAVKATLYPLIGFSFLLISGYLPFVIVGLLLSALLFFRLRPKNRRS
jgi:N-acetylneuraminic acid mutarotase